MIRQFRDKWFIIFWYTESVGWMICGKESIEETMESAFADETNIANLHGVMWSHWVGLP